MQIKKLMTRRAECIEPEASLQEAAERMRKYEIGALPVCDHEHLVGMLTDRDIAIRSVSQGHDPCCDKVRDAMTPRVFYCYEDQDITEAAEIMKRKQVRRLPVLDRQEHLTGILSLGDLAVETGNEELAGDALEGISEPASPKR